MNEDTFRKLVDKDYADNFMTGRIYELTQEEINQLSQPKESDMTTQQKFYEWLLQKGYRMRNGKIIKYPSLEEISDSEAEALQNEYQAKVR